MTDAEVLLKFLAAGIRVLSARALLVLTLILTFILFCWAMYWPEYTRIAIATIFAIFVFIPVRQLDAKKDERKKED